MYPDALSGLLLRRAPAQGGPARAAEDHGGGRDMRLLLRPLSLIEEQLNNLAALLMLAMMVMVSGDVLASFALNSPLPGKIELTEFFMVGIVYASLAYTQMRKGHIHIDLLLIRLSPRKRLLSETATYLLTLLFFALLLWRSTAMALDAWQSQEVTMGVEALPVYPAKMLVPIGSLLMCLRLVVDVVASVVELIRPVGE
jgi:TRAP-type C4-dicarboxylate transport system permease small subunit